MYPALCRCPVLIVRCPLTPLSSPTAAFRAELWLFIYGAERRLTATSCDFLRRLHSFEALMQTLRFPVSAFMLAIMAACAHAEAPATPEAMAARIDELLGKRWSEEKIQPAKGASDAELLRRVSLDLVGVIPTVASTRAFLADTSPDKRAALFQKLLESPRHASHMASVWRARMLPEQFDPGQLQTAMGLQNWLRRKFAENLRYDNLVADLVSSTGSRETGPALYFTSLELKPEKLAASTARIFMGLQIQCAECHDHPFDHWKQEDFWGYAAFFAQLEGAGMEQQPVNPAVSVLRDRNAGDVMIPGKDDVIAPRYPGGGRANQSLGGTRRQQLAIWLASRDNPYLARAAVNWAWAHLFGRGLVEPVDDLGDHNPPSHPVLMQELCDFFEEQQFDIQKLLFTLCSTKAYQSTSHWESDAVAPELFAHMAVKTMTAEQHFDSLATCLTQAEPQGLLGGVNGDQRRLQFITRMQTAARSSLEYESGPRQALQLMNGPLATEATNPQQSALLGSLEAPFFTDAQRLETLYLATLSRLPREDERVRLTPLFNKVPDAESRQRLLGDVLWAILNSAEYGLNH